MRQQERWSAVDTKRSESQEATPSMKRQISDQFAPATTELERIKRLVVVAMFSDDLLLERLVLKGGNAIDLVYKLSARSSMDIDLSMGEDFPGGSDALAARISRALSVTFRDEQISVFDVRIADRPENMSPELADFWGGYKIEFKLIEEQRYKALADDLEALRREAIRIGSAGKFMIDISRHEFVDGKQAVPFDGYRIFVYSPEMIIAEKLRAICQQLSEYGPVIHRNRAGSPRARDFVDIWRLCQYGKAEPVSPENRALLEAVFAAKRVPLTFLRQVHTQREFHRTEYRAVLDTAHPGETLAENFDEYFDFVLDLIGRLETFGDV